MHEHSLSFRWGWGTCRKTECNGSGFREVLNLEDIPARADITNHSCLQVMLMACVIVVRFQSMQCHSDCF